MESIQFVWSRKDKRVHILLNDEETLELTLCGDGGGGDMAKEWPGTDIPDSDVMCRACLRGAAQLADIWDRRYGEETKPR